MGRRSSNVVYNTKKEELKKAIGSFLNTDLKVKLWISDNSPTNNLEKELDTLLTECEKEYDIKNIKDKVEYIFNNHNGGYRVSMPGANLAATIKKHNGYVKNGSDPDFGKRIDKGIMMTIKSGPYYAIPQWLSIHHTMGPRQP